jgi:hypothetical protein
MKLHLQSNKRTRVQPSSLGRTVSKPIQHKTVAFDPLSLTLGVLAVKFVSSVLLPLLVIRFTWILGDLVSSDYQVPKGYRSYSEYFTTLFIPFSKYPFRLVAATLGLLIKRPKVRQQLAKAPPHVRQEFQRFVRQTEDRARYMTAAPTAAELQKARDQALNQLRRGSPKAYRAFQRLDRKLDSQPCGPQR